MRFLLSIVVVLGTTLSAFPATAEERPNILWIVSEDNSPYLGCYGDPLAQTPNIDRLATEGVRYRNAFSTAPVCSAARSTLITGMYATTLGIHNHRSTVAIPSSFHFYPEVLREGGYYCTNNSKTDYNVAIDGKRSPSFFWDASSNKAHYKDRPEGQPFFAVFNIGFSHEGQTTDQAYLRRRDSGAFPPERIVPPDEVILPPYHPDTPVIRENWSRYYDNLWLMDQRVGKLLDELEAEGLAENTIVFYYSDHGGALPRGKRNITDSGTRVPLIIRFPEKYRHLAPAAAGDWIDQPVAFVDFPATLCSLAGVPIPENYQGNAFLGDQASEPCDHVFLFRGRMDERYDTVRAIRTSKYLYVKNFSPHRPWGQYYSYPFRVLMSMQSWYDSFQDGRCNAVQARYWQEKPSEEFYVIADDPYQINNLIDAPEYRREIDQLRQTLHDEILKTGDAGLIPEGMYERLRGDLTLYDYAQGDDYPAKRVLEAATLGTARASSKLGDLIDLMDDSYPPIRYWAATGCLILKDQAAQAREPLLALLEDSNFDVRVVAAEALGYLGEVEAATVVLAVVLKSGNDYETLAALTAIENFARAGLLSIDQAQAFAQRNYPEPVNRVATWINSLER